MKMIFIDGECISSMDALHDLFAEKLELPDYYGRNLDALFDVLTEVTESVMICVDHQEQLIESLDGQASALFSLLERAGEENENISCFFSAE